ncbi:MAG: YceI family protein [Bacteroidia bacterium]|nr:YceI family protein [Bacteroidia bacterium]
MNRSLSCLWLLLAGCLPLASQTYTRVLIDPASTLTLEGASNVSAFQCDCSEPFSVPAQILICETASREAVSLSQATLSLRTAALDCGNRMMNQDMYASLKATEHPQIRIELTGATLASGQQLSQLNQWADVQVHSLITIAGVRRQVPLHVKAVRLAEHRYRFTGVKPLLMTDFNIQPPTAMLGMVKVQNEIRIHLDLLVTAD